MYARDQHLDDEASSLLLLPQRVDDDIVRVGEPWLVCVQEADVADEITHLRLPHGGDGEMARR